VKVITQRDLIRGVAYSWGKQYARHMEKDPEYGLATGESYMSIHLELLALNSETATAEDVEAIIGNGSWTGLKCNECGKYPVSVIQVGDEPDYESSTAHLCALCARDAAALMVDQP